MCKKCNGSGLVPLPRGMSPGFYRFMAAGCIRRDDGTLMMNCDCRAALRRTVDAHREQLAEQEYLSPPDVY